MMTLLCTRSYICCSKHAKYQSVNPSSRTFYGVCALYVIKLKKTSPLPWYNTSASGSNQKKPGIALGRFAKQ